MVEGVVTAFFTILAFIAGVILGMFIKGRLCLLLVVAVGLLTACATPPRYVCRGAIAETDGHVPVLVCDPVRLP